MSRRLGLMLGLTALFWLVAVYPASLQWGNEAFALSALAAGLCLVPTLASLLWGVWAQEQAPAQQLLMIVGGTGLRMVVVLGVGLALSVWVPYFEKNLKAFWIWVLVFYMFTLGLEVTLLILGRSGKQPAERGPSE